MKGDSAREKQKKKRKRQLVRSWDVEHQKSGNLSEDRRKMMRDEMYQGNGPPLRIAIEEERMRRKEPMVNRYVYKMNQRPKIRLENGGRF